MINGTWYELTLVRAIGMSPARRLQAGSTISSDSSEFSDRNYPSVSLAERRFRFDFRAIKFSRRKLGWKTIK
jgi:hypothetical protein